MLDRILDELAAPASSEVVVNAHHLAEHDRGAISPAARRRAIQVSHESERLETGGGVVKALPMLGAEPFFVVNGDVLWRDGAVADAGGAGRRLGRRTHGRAAAGAVRPQRRSATTAPATSTSAKRWPPVRRRGRAPSAPFLFAGVQILHPRLFADAPTAPFSLNVLYDRAIAAGRAFGVASIDGGWCHVGTPADIAAAEAFLAAEAR